MSDKGIILKIDEAAILNATDDMCCESLPPELHEQWERIRECLKETRKQLRLLPLAAPVTDAKEK